MRNNMTSDVIVVVADVEAPGLEVESSVVEAAVMTIYVAVA